MPQILKVHSMCGVLGLALIGIALVTCSGCRSDGSALSRAETVETGSSPNGSGGEFTEYEAYVFKMAIPTDVTVEETQQADFYRYEFFLGEDRSRPFLVAHDAAFPPFPYLAPETAPVDITNVGRLEMRSIRWKPESDAALRSREVVLTFQESETIPPKRLHLMYSDLPEHDADIADRIMESVRYYQD